MIPIRDENPTTRTPIVTWLLVAACLAVWLAQLGVIGPGDRDLVAGYAMVPERVFAADHHAVIEVAREDGRIVRETIGPAALSAWLPPRAAEWLTLLTCIFLHGSWLHVLGNVWVLLVFGDNVEERFGRLRYLLLYLGCGVAASAAHLWSAVDSAVPVVGASGAIAGVMGAYLLLYPTARVLTLIPFFIPIVIVVPAALFLGVWFAMQFAHTLVEDNQVGGVAWWAHVGGFAVGAVITLLLRVAGKLRPAADRIELRAYRARG